MATTLARVAGLGFILLLAACGSLSTELPGEAPQVSLVMTSPYLWSGGDAEFSISLDSESGRGLRGDMLDRACLRVKLDEGRVLTALPEGIKEGKLNLGDRSSISRTVNLKPVLGGLKTQTVEIWWEYGDWKSDLLSARLYAWDLAKIEAVMETDQGEIVIAFFPDKAPGTVQNFVDLVLKGFYTGHSFHRIVPGFMIQGGCPHGDGTGDPGYMIKGEFSDISHVRGILSMARSKDPDSAGCQFFIMHGDNPYLDGQYAAFGHVTSGMDVVDRIAEVETVEQHFGEEKSRPVEPPRIRKITIRKITKKEPEKE